MNKKPFLFVTPFLCLSIFFMAQSAFSTVRKVPTQFKSIREAVRASSPGDKILVAQGTYFEHITLKKGVILQGGWNKGFSKRDPRTFETVIDGIKEKGPVIIGADNAIVEGFTIIHGSLLVKGDESLGSGIYCDKTSPRIISNIIRDNEPSGVFCSASRARIEHNKIFGNAQAGIFAEKGSNLQIIGNIIHGNKYSGVSSGKPPVSILMVKNNKIYENHRSGINAHGATGSIYNNIIFDNKKSGIRGRFSPLAIHNNTVVGNGQSGFFMEDPSAVADVRNNIFVRNEDAGVRTSGKGYANNLFYANGGVGACNPDFLWCVRPQFGGYEDEQSYKKSKNIIADPLFKDARHHDYHLMAGSPAIDAGDKKAKFNDIHFPPSLGTKVNDIGAYGGPYVIPEKRGVNHAPKADPGKDLLLPPGKRAILDGSGSFDPDGDGLTYKWSLVSSPSSGSAKLSGQDRKKASFLAKRPGTYIVQLVVRDRWGASSKPKRVKITILSNRAPKAVISDVISSVSVGDSITLYGSASTDPDKDKLTYKWSLKFKPSSSNAVLQGADKKECTLQIDADGGYAVQLIVGDGKTHSKPAIIYINTRGASQGGVRRVPEDYPTIQAAIDAAQPGDDILVAKGHYQELLNIDKSVNLIGKDWPVIDGGSPDGNRNTISIFYLGDRAGKVEGFVITGGGTGSLGHGINIWDSSPEILNNKITGNHHGIGIHGSPAQTGRTKIHGNLIYENMVGIGNGKDSQAHIYDNRVYKNSVVGIGCRGKAAPRIEDNQIYGNHIGLGVREVAAPRIFHNQIVNNTDGVVVGPLSTIKSFAFKDIVIDGNLIAKNSHLGISLTSFNKSKVVVVNNTIDSNNFSGRRLRAGGLVIGYPQPAGFEVVIQGNIISNNKTGGIINYLGPEDFQKDGAVLRKDFNIVWQNSVDFLDCSKGPHDRSVDPGFASTDLQEQDAYVAKNAVIDGKKIGYRGPNRMRDMSSPHR